jgi:hypothetical protein
LKEMELTCLGRFENILTEKCYLKQFNDTHKKFQLALNVYWITTMYCMIGNVNFNRWEIEAYFWSGHPLTTSPVVTIVPLMTSRIGQESSDSSMDTLLATIHALTVGRILVPVLRKWSGSTRHHRRSASSSFSRIRADWRVSLPYPCIKTRLVMRRYSIVVLYIVNADSPSMKLVQHLYTYCLIRELTLSHSYPDRKLWRARW